MYRILSVIHTSLTSVARLKQEVQMNMMKHKIAKNVLSAREFWFFVVPRAILTMLSSILAFVATSDLLDMKTKVIINKKQQRERERKSFD